MDYKESQIYIAEKNSLGIIPGLDNVLGLLHALRDPQLRVPAIHIAGTNGKGSIMSFVEHVLIRAGLKVGRYISPTLVEYRERWTINGVMPDEETVAELMTRIRAAEEMLAGKPTAFETETALAFLWFAEQDCDIMLIECGMGGRLDATNVMPEKVVDILATVSMDHMQFLGDTREKILKEKLGIVRVGDVLVTSPLDEELRGYLEEERIPYVETDIRRISEVRQSLQGTEFLWDGEPFRIPMPGQVALENAATALTVLEEYDRRAAHFHLPGISREALREGLRETVWPGRFMVLNREPVVILDGAHNRDAWKRLAEELAGFFPEKKLTFVLGVLRDKEVSCMLDTLLPLAEKVYTFTPDSPRGMDGAELARWIEEAGTEARYLKNVTQAVQAALTDAADEDVIVISGSLSFMGDLLREGGFHGYH